MRVENKRHIRAHQPLTSFSATEASIPPLRQIYLIEKDPTHPNLHLTEPWVGTDFNVQTRRPIKIHAGTVRVSAGCWVGCPIQD